jgi:hypothetical protein
MLTAIDSGNADSVYVMSVEDGVDIAGMGGLMGTAMRARNFWRGDWLRQREHRGAL